MTFARYTGQEIPGRPGQDPREPAGHPAHQLRDARADADPAGRPQIADPDGRAAWSSSSSTSCTPTAAARARTSRCSSAGSRTPARRPTCSASARRPPCPPRARARTGARVVADVAGEIFGTPVAEENVIGETLSARTDAGRRAGHRARIAAPVAPAGYADLPRPARLVDRDHVRAGPRRRGQAGPAQAGDGAAGRALNWPRRPAPTRRSARRPSSAPCRPGRGPGPDEPAGRCSPSGCTSSCPRATPSTSRWRTRHPPHHPRLPGRAARTPAASCCYPLAFCRECGQEYLAVWRQDQGRHSQLPRPPRHRHRRRTTRRRRAARSSYADGYLYVSADMPWPRDRADRRRRPAGARILAGNRRSHRRGRSSGPPPGRYLPQPVTVDVYGQEQPGQRRPRGRVHPRAVPVLPALRGLLRAATAARTSPSWPPSTGRPVIGDLADLHVDHPVACAIPARRRWTEEARKLLTFVDNRQDAALQAGHFNDFVAGHHDPRRAVPGGRRGRRGRRGRPVLRRHPRPGDPRARPGTPTSTPANLARPRRCAGAPTRRCARW